MEADRAREREPGVAGSSPAATELNRAFVPDRLGRTVLLAEYLVLRLSAANDYPLVRLVILILSNHNTVTTTSISEKHSLPGRRLHTKQSLHDGETRHDPRLRKLKATGQSFRTFEIVLREVGQFLSSVRAA